MLSSRTTPATGANTDFNLPMKPCLLLTALLLLSPGVGWTQRVNIPLTVSETAGLDRHQYPITTGLPLPRGLLKSAGVLQLMDRQGGFVPAAIQEMTRWPGDGSLQWIQVHFAASLPANGQAVYYLREVGALPRFPSPIGLAQRENGLEIVTGPLRLVMGGRSQQLLDQVWVDENWGYDFSHRTKILESGNFRITLRSGGRRFRMSPWTGNRVEVEEANAIRAVVKVSGTFVSDDLEVSPFDYVARVTVYGGKTFFKLGLTLVHAGGSGFEPLPLEDLSIQAKLNLDPFSQRFALGGMDRDHQGHFDQTSAVSLYLENADSYQLSGVAVEADPVFDGSDGGPAAGRLCRVVSDKNTLNLGWADLSDDRHGLALGVRWFWQLYPKAFEIRKSGTLITRLFPEQAKPQPIPVGMSKTHEVLFYFHGGRSFAEGRVKNELLGLQKPIFAFAPAAWYCRKSGALGVLSESSPDIYREGYWPMVQKYDGWIESQRELLLAERGRRRDKSGGDGYGWLRFGGGRSCQSSSEKSDGRVSRCDDRTYDLAYALYLHFFRTGDSRSLEVAEEIVAHWADLGISHHRDPHFSGTPFGGAPASWDGRHHETLLHSFLLTGNRRALDAARLWLEHVVELDGTNLAQAPHQVAPVLLGLLKGYAVLGDQRFLERARWIVEVIHAWQAGDLKKLRRLSPTNALRWKETYRGGYGSAAWKCGELWWALTRTREWFARDEIPVYMRRSADWVLGNLKEWFPGSKVDPRFPLRAMSLAPGLASIYESSGDLNYWKLALEVFTRGVNHVEESATLPVDAYFHGAQHFLWYLSRDFHPPKAGSSHSGLDPIGLEGAGETLQRKPRRR